MSDGIIRVEAILPTYNRAERLHQALAAHAALRIPDHVQYRLIVVDNNSNDGTRNIVESFIAEDLLHCSYRFEPRQGLSQARNAGLRALAADTDVVAFIDDDCYPDPDWVEVLTRILSADHAPGLVGGSAFLYDPEDLPITIVTGPHRATQSLATLFSGIAGLNFGFPVRLLGSIGDFDTCLGAGSACKAGEDIDFFYRAMQAGERVEYHPELRVHHHHGRQDPSTVSALMDGYYRGRGAFYLKHLLRLDRPIIQQAYWTCRKLLLGTPGIAGSRDLHLLGQLLRGAATYAACAVGRSLGRLVSARTG